MKALHSIAFVLLIIGGLNWLVVGVTSTGWDVGLLFGAAGNPIARVIYILVGLSAVYLAAIHKSSCKNCEAGSETSSAV